MTLAEWAELERLCRKVLDEAEPTARTHPLYEAVATTGAFAASVQHHSNLDAADEPEHHAH